MSPIIQKTTIKLDVYLMKMKSIYQYFDYREYLSNYYLEQKSRNKHISYRSIAEKVDVSHSLVLKIFKGERHLSLSKINAFSQFLKLSKQESQYFEALVLYNKAKTEHETQQHLNKILSLLPTQKETIQAHKYRYFNKWYYAAIRSLLEYIDIKDNFEYLAKQLRPKIKPVEAKAAIELLDHLELIHQNADGFWKPTENHLTTGDHWSSTIIKNFQQDSIELAKNAVNRFPKNETDMSTLTLTMNHKHMNEVRLILKECRQKIIHLIDNDPTDEVNSLFQLNMQLFPMAHKKDEHEND